MSRTEIFCSAFLLAKKGIHEEILQAGYKQLQEIFQQKPKMKTMNCKNYMQKDTIKYCMMQRCTYMDII